MNGYFFVEVIPEVRMKSLCKCRRRMANWKIVLITFLATVAAGLLIVLGYLLAGHVVIITPVFA